MKRLLPIVLALSLALAAGAQTLDKDRGQKSATVMDKVDTLNLMNQINPLVMTKEQIRKILPAIEKARQKVKDIEKVEADELRRLEEKLDGALKDGYEKAAVPSPDLIKELQGIFNAMRIRRELIASENAENVLKVVLETLNVGQKKAAANSLNPKQFNPNFKPEEFTEEDRLRLYTREILLHPLAYDLLVKLSK